MIASSRLQGSSKGARLGAMSAKGTPSFRCVDLDIPKGLAPIEAAGLVERAADLGIRSVSVPAASATAAHAALRGRTSVSISCEEVVDWPGDSLLLHVGERLQGHLADELVIPVGHELLGDASWCGSKLRKVLSRCHALGVFANIVVDVQGLNVAELRALVRGVARMSVNALTLEMGKHGEVSHELVGAAVDEAKGRVPVRVAARAISPSRLERLCDLGVQSVVVSPQGLSSLLMESTEGPGAEGSAARSLVA